MARILLKPVKIYGDIKNGTLEADSRGLVFIGYSIESGKFFVLNENIETGYDTYTLEEVAGKLGLTIEFLQGVVARGEIVETDELFPVAGEVESIEATEPVVEEEAQTITQEDLEDALGYEKVSIGVDLAEGDSVQVEEIVPIPESEIDFKGLYMDAMEENKRLTEENMDLFKETVQLTQENTNLKAELDLLKTDDRKLAELVKSKGYMLIVR